MESGHPNARPRTARGRSRTTTPRIALAIGGALLSMLVAAPSSAYPVELDRLEAACCVVDVARHGDLLVVAFDDPADLVGLRLYDDTDPSAPAAVAEVPLDAAPTSVSVSASGHAYAAVGPGGLRVVDLSVPSAPTVVGSIPVAGHAFRVEVRGTRAYVGTHADGLHVFDVSAPAAPSLVATVGDDGRTLADFDVAGTVAGLCVSLVGNARPVSFRTVDLADPLAPVALGTTEDFGDPILAEARQALGCNVVTSNGSDFFTDGDWLFAVSQSLSFDSRALLAFDAPAYSSARNAGGLEVTSAPMSGAAANGSLVHVVNGGLLQTFDVDSPGNDPLGSVPVWNEWGASEMVAEPDLVFVTAGPLGVTTFDVASPAAPALVSHLTPESGSATDVVLVGDVAVVSDAVARLRVVDVSVPSTLQPLSTVPLAAEDIEVMGSTVLAGTSAPVGLQLVDLSLPASPVLLGFVPLPGPGSGCVATQEIVDVEVTGSIAAVLTTCSGLHLIDVSDPSAPVEVGGVSWLDGHALDVQGSLLAVLIRDTSTPPFPPNGIVGLYDVSDPTAPAYVSHLGANLYEGAGMPLHVKLHGGHAFLFSESGQLLVFDLAAPSSPEIASIPFSAGYDTRAEVVVDGDRIFPTGRIFLSAVDVSDPTAPFVAETWWFPSSVDNAVVRDDVLFTAEGEQGFASYLIDGLAVPVASPLGHALGVVLLIGVAVVGAARRSAARRS